MCMNDAMSMAKATSSIKNYFFYHGTVNVSRCQANWGRMKWNTEQLELGLNPYRSTQRTMQRLSQRRLQRASWWFEQMRRAVDNAEACADLGPDRATNAEEPATNQLHDDVFFGSMGV
jgi:hypothetical protein